MKGQDEIRTPPFFFEFVSAPQAKIMPQIMQIDVENYTLFFAFEGAHPLKHPLCPHVQKFCHPLI